MTEGKMLGWHNQLKGQRFARSPGDGGGQGSLTCFSPWGPKESDKTVQLNNAVHFWTELKVIPSASDTGKMYFILQSRVAEWCSGKEPACQCRRCKRHEFDPWVGKIP